MATPIPQSLYEACHTARLDIFGAFNPVPHDGAPGDCRTLVMLGPLEPGFWPAVSAESEFTDHRPDPLDRWSLRVIGALATRLEAAALFPFGGPPHLPFYGWALASGHAFASPVGLLVHDRAGLMVSYRGALAFSARLNLPTHSAQSPCTDCPRPCLSACPSGALTSAGYDVAACHAWLDTQPGKDCLYRGCALRRSCPVSQKYGRLEQQSAFHMGAFHRR